MALRTSPTIFDNMFEYILKGYKSHHTIPDNDVDGLLYVISQVKKSAKKYKKKYNKMPSLIIDGSDILAKWKPEAFTMLVEKAKASANEGTLRIVFVSSEGYIMPLVDGTSSRSRVENIVEVLDISREIVRYCIFY